MDHKSHDEISRQIEEVKDKIVIDSDYAHYKDASKIYRPKGFGTLEADDSLCVIYEAQYGDYLVFIRPVSEWLEQVEWRGKVVLRFTKL